MLHPPPSWQSRPTAWPDALAFAGGLAVAWVADWRTTDLVWSLWLSSVVVGLASIVWMVMRPGLDLGSGILRDRREVVHLIGDRGRGTAAMIATLAAAGGLAVLGFMTLHFWGFHYVHSSFLAHHFPVAGMPASWGMTDLSAYREVVIRYAPFLPWAFLAERTAFMRRPVSTDDDASVTAEAIGARKQRHARRAQGLLIGPYRNVVRMHLLIFFFMLAHAAGLRHFVVYAVVYATYFFPWRLLRRGVTNPLATSGGSG